MPTLKILPASLTKLAAGIARVGVSAGHDLGDIAVGESCPA